jgi:hypothetical protein
MLFDFIRPFGVFFIFLRVVKIEYLLLVIVNVEVKKLVKDPVLSLVPLQVVDV